MSRLTLSSLRSTAFGLWKIAKGGLMLAGLVALVTWEVETFGHAAPAPVAAIAKPAPAAATPQGLENVHPARVAESLAGEAVAETAGKPENVEERVALAAALGDPGQHRRIANYLSKKYQVSSEATNLIVSAAYITGRDTGVDPTLILAVMAIESRFNPFAESGMGAQGLMQVIPKYHLDKF